VRKILFIRPPAHLWPILNESDNFLLPLAFPCMAAYLRQHRPDLELKFIDCLPLKIGWTKLRQVIAREKPDMVAVGEGTVYMKEGMRALELARELDPDVVTVAGGHFHSHMPEYTLEQFPFVDFVVMYEGEHAFLQLIEALADGGDLARVQNLAYRDGEGEARITDPGPLCDLDQLPMPAYDLVPIERYSPFGLLWPKAITIQGSRGCSFGCDFCSWTNLEGEHHRGPDGEMVLTPRRRQKSVERTLAEIDLLYNKYGVRYLFWVDATWNFDSEWLDGLSEGILQRGYKLGWWAFVRADLMLEQEQQGVLEKMVRAGLRHTLFGGERPEQSEMEEIGKGNLDANALLRACHLLERKYPEVFRQATFTTGIRSESAETIERLADYSRRCHLDFAAYHALQPYPGTALWRHAREQGWIEEEDFSNYDMFNPIMATEHLSREEVAHLTSKITQDFVGKQPLSYFSKLVSPHAIRRRLHWWFLFSIGRVIASDAVRSARGEKHFEGFGGITHLWKPSWYD